MLRELRIKNFAVIDEVALELGPGLNVLTGETGAGKSIILNALGLISGNRVATDVIRHQTDEASVEALFDGVPSGVNARLQASGIELEDELIVKRIISRSGKNRVYVAGGLCQLAVLADLGTALVHIYGQHEQHTLLDADSHIRLLDAFCGVTAQAESMAQHFQALTASWHAVQRSRALIDKRKKDKTLLQAQIEEIGAARLKPDEEAELQERKNVLTHAEKLFQACREGEELLYDGEGAIIGRLGRYANRLREMAHIDAALQPALDLVTAAQANLDEANSELRRYAERVHFEPGALEQLEDRLAEISRLKRKYGGTIAEMLEKHAAMEADLRELDRGEEELPALDRAFDSARQTAWSTAGDLSQARRNAAKRLKKEMEKELRDLGMPDTSFEVRFVETGEKEDEPPFFVGGKKITPSGIDQVEFYFSPNPGEPPKPLTKIASGGELSRVMLAIKALVLTPGDIPTLLFDEVDAGVGGAVAEIVGQKLRQVAADHQVICVTHLPQIAALADCHYAVRKQVDGGRTSTRVLKLNARERVDEVARMLGGVKITEKTRRHAEEMVRGR